MVESRAEWEQFLSKKRDNKYFKDRLSADFPVVYADLVSGKIKNVRQACLRAGLIQPVTRDSALIRDYKLATPAEKRIFADWLRSRPGSKKSTTSPISDASGRLDPTAISLIRAWLHKESISPGKLLSQIGKHSNFDVRLSRALQGDPLPSNIISDLDVWLRAHGFK